MPDQGYIVVPFVRVGTMIGPRQLLFFDALPAAQFTAKQFSSHVPGVAIVRREIDAETGESVDQLVEQVGAIPPDCPTGWDWTLRLH